MRASSSLDPPSSILLLSLCRNQKLRSQTSRRVLVLTSSKLELSSPEGQNSSPRVRPREGLKDSSFERKIGRKLGTSCLSRWSSSRGKCSGPFWTCPSG